MRCDALLDEFAILSSSMSDTFFVECFPLFYLKDRRTAFFTQHRKDKLESKMRKELIDNDFLRHWTLDKED
jgi:hypothetical protein